MIWTVATPIGPDRPTSWRFGIGDRIVQGRAAIRPLGAGLHHETFLAWDGDLFAPVVVRLLRPSCVFDDGCRAALALEATAAARFNHPAFPRLLDSVPDGDRPHIVVEYLEGMSLSAVLETAPLDRARFLSLARTLCSVVHHMAAADWVHLDLGPGAVIMGSPPRLLAPIAARPIADARRLRAPIGNPAWRAPEARHPSRSVEIGGSTNVWSVGAILRQAAVAPAADRPGHVPRDPLPGALDDVLAACLHDDPERRPTAAAVDAALAELASLTIRAARDAP